MVEINLIQQRYELGDIIGEGAWGTVYRAHDKQTGAVVAIKRLKTEILFSLPHAVERFNREAGALRRLNHPFIVKVFEAVVDGDQHCIVMEYITGHSLRDAIDAPEKMSIRQVVRAAWEIADALTALHPLGLVHRDIKPNNILFAQDGSVRLMDFGLVRIAGLESITETGMPMGTTHYLAPEGLKGEIVDGRADIWSLGVLLYEMLTGQPPFDGRNLATIIMAIIKTPLPDIRAACPTCPPELAMLLEQMLAKERDERLATAGEVRDILANILKTL